MRRIPNPNQTLMTVFGSLTVVAAIVAAIGFLVGGDGGFVYGLVGAIFAGILGFILPILWITGRNQTKEIEKLLGGEGLLAHWQYDQDQWDRFTTNEFDRGVKLARKAAIWTFIGVFVLMMAAVLLGGGGVTGVFFGIALAFSAGLTLVVGALLYVPTLLTYRSHRQSVGEVFIGNTAVYYANKYYTWSSKWATLEKVAFEPGDPSVVQFDYRVGSGDSTSHVEVRVPIPRGKESEAVALVQSFYAAS